MKRQFTAPSNPRLIMTMMMIVSTWLGSGIRYAHSFTHNPTSSLIGPSSSLSRRWIQARYSITSIGSSSSSTSSNLDGDNNESDYGQGMNQIEMMESDMLVIVDEEDRLLLGGGGDSTGGSSSSSSITLVSKGDAHSFSKNQPRGILHRAFSLFCFNDKDELLLTQRAANKITFPNVWTNTACSHPLLPQAAVMIDGPSQPAMSSPSSSSSLWWSDTSEVDIWPDAYPNVPGIKRAAIRKAKHELGLDLTPFLDNIQFVTRFHYWASDVPTHGSQTPWGEHEIDYILMVRLSGEEQFPPMTINPDEVANIRYVTADQLRSMFLDKERYTWSPWFLGIMERGGFDWWDDLDGTLMGKYTNSNIEYFDPPTEHVAEYNLDCHTRQTGVMKTTTTTRNMTAAERLMATEPKNWVRIT